MINPQMVLQLLPLLKGNTQGTLNSYGKDTSQYNGNMSDPKSITEYLVNSGQVDQQTLNNAQMIAQQMGYRL